MTSSPAGPMWAGGMEADADLLLVLGIAQEDQTVKIPRCNVPRRDARRCIAEQQKCWRWLLVGRRVRSRPPRDHN